MASEYKLKVVGEFDDKMSKGVGTATQSLGGLGDGLDGLKNKAAGFGEFLKANLVSSAITSSLAAIRDGIKATTSALVDMGKEAYNEGAKLEQAIGGVETMFKGDALQVKINAEDAWKSGISENDYMEQVTSFSAALIKSLGGDTSKAADVANMAIMDMADNANKFGTDLGSIQNAYQGFAKQNYTMLDNLKLGYGGTKEEMERMLADAEKLTGVHYDISNLSDVFNAIHAIQTEMGVAGVSAEEARTTMEGSAKKMRAAWKNLLGHMTLNETITYDVDNLKESIGDFASNFVPAVEQILDNIPTLADGVVDIAKDMMSRFGTEIVTRAGPLAEAGGKIIGTVLSGLTTSLPDLLTIGKDVVTSIGTSISDNGPEILDSVAELGEMIIDSIPDVLSFLSGTGGVIADGIVSLMGQLPDLLDKYSNIFVDWALRALENIGTWMDNVPFDKLASSFIQSVQSLVRSINRLLSNSEFATQLGTALQETLSGIVDAFSPDDWSKLFGTIFDSITDFVIAAFADPDTFGEAGSKIAETLVKSLGVIDGQDMKTAITSVMTGIWSFIDGFVNRMMANDEFTEVLRTRITEITGSMAGWFADNMDAVSEKVFDTLYWFFFDLSPAAAKGLWEGLVKHIPDAISGFGTGIMRSGSKVATKVIGWIMGDDALGDTWAAALDTNGDEKAFAEEILKIGKISEEFFKLNGADSPFDAEMADLYKLMDPSDAGKLLKQYNEILALETEAALNGDWELLGQLLATWRNEIPGVVQSLIDEAGGDTEQRIKASMSDMREALKKEEELAWAGDWVGLGKMMAEYGNAVSRVTMNLIDGHREEAAEGIRIGMQAAAGTILSEGDNVNMALYDVYSSASEEAAEGISTGARNVVYTINSEGDNVNTALSDISTNASEEITEGIRTGIQDAADTIHNEGANVTTALSDVAEEASATKDMWTIIGENIVAGIQEGVEDKNPDLWNTLKNMALDAYDIVRTMFGIASPSKLMRDEIGQYIPEGIAVGIDANTDSIRRAMEDVRNTVIDGADTVLGNTDAARYGGGTGDGAHTVNVGGVTNYVYGAQGQDEATLADSIVDILVARLRQEGAVFA